MGQNLTFRQGLYHKSPDLKNKLRKNKWNNIMNLYYKVYKVEKT